MDKRVVVTGMGVVSPLGSTLDQYWQNLSEGNSGVSLIERIPTDQLPTKIAGEIKDFDPSSCIDKKESRRLDLFEQFALVASCDAIDDSKLDLEALDLDRCGVVIGSGIGGITTMQDQILTMDKSGPSRVSPFLIPTMIIDMCAGLVSIKFGFRGPNYATVSACASSSHAVIDSFRILQRGDADVMITGGSEAPITNTALAGFSKAKALSVRNDEPQKASRPFDLGRDGFVMGEGAGIFVLEEYEHALARGAKIYGEIKGVGMTGDAYHMTAPHPEGYGARKSMEIAIKDAGLKPEDIDHVNTHGTSTELGDIAETKAIKEVLGDHAYTIPINSTKSMTGHLLGAAGAIELIASLLSIKHQEAHPTINLDNPDPQCDLNYVANVKQSAKIDNIMSNSFGFGGHNVTLVAGKLNGKE